MNQTVAPTSASSMVLFIGTIASFILLILPTSSSFSTLNNNNHISTSSSLLSHSKPSSQFLSLTTITAAATSESESEEEKELQILPSKSDHGNRLTGTKTMNRRTSMGLLGGALFSFPTASDAAAVEGGSKRFNFGEGPSLFEQVSAIETANYVGQPGRPVYTPNVRGEPANNMPQVNVINSEDGINVEVYVNHVMTNDDYVKFIWLKDVNSNDVVLVKGFPSNTLSPPTLKARVPKGVELRPYAFVIGEKDGLWKGESFIVPSS